MAITPHVLPHRELAPAGRPVLGGVRAGLAAVRGSVPERIWALSDEEVCDSLTSLADLATATSALLVTVLAEARQRSLGSSQGWDLLDWARAHAPMLPTRTLLDAHAVASAVGDLRLEAVVEAVRAGARPDDPGEDGAAVGGSCIDGSGTDGSGADATSRDREEGEAACWGSDAVLPVGKAAQLVRFNTGVRGLADPAQLEGATRLLLQDSCGPHGLSEKDVGIAVRRTADLLRPDRLVEHEADVRRAHQSLVKSKGPCGLSRYTLLLDEEAAAVVDAAVDVLAKPKPDADTGEHDPRTPAARRADALVDLVRRAVSAPDGQPKQPKTMLTVTVPLEVLQRRCRGAGVLPDGSHVTVDTVRRLACDAHVVPAVLGSHGEVLEQGQAVRLFTRPQLRHLWQRDKRCTFPGCSKPPAWADGHHLIHWADDGPSDVDNAALLCRAHHTVVHRERLGGRVEAGPHGPRVVWDLRPDSYDAHLEEFRAGRKSDGTPPRP
ncbi:DUF222 domain-containing protein [Pedococcus sp. NPDC057267]|uniref:HNH endonuclease signature motif containing protein n=1 Tax=Pedococcus sp. NPDC057267 TaxID=3346077 RepID=UPI003644B8F2